MSNYTLHLYWGGWDPDGEIAYFEYTVTDNEDGIFDPADTTGAEWLMVARNDSSFTFSADELADPDDVDPLNLDPVDFIRSHTFFIRAVDDEGKRSAKPAYRSFTARTLSPVIDILVPTTSGSTPAQVPPISTFQWVARDYISNLRQVQDPDSVRWILLSTELFEGSWGNTIQYIRENPDAEEWYPWKSYSAPGDSGKFWTTPALDFGPWVFAIQVKDEAGAISPVFDESRNVRRLLVSQRSTGPTLIVFNKFIGTMITSSPNTPLTIIDLPAKVPMTFEFRADARSYGGVVSGYRYGWDIQDLSDPSQWDVDWTPFVTDNNSAESIPRTFEFDSHTFHVEVIDNSGYTSRVGVRVNIVPFTMSKNVLLVDDWEENSSGFGPTIGGLPSDIEHDAFWVDMLSDVDQFDPAVDMMEVTDNLPINVLADYKSLIWVATAAYNSATPSLINDVIEFVDPDIPSTGGKTTPNIVSLFMAAGGHVLLCGEQIMTASINRTSYLPSSPSFPLIFRYELQGDQDGRYEDSVIGQRGVGDNAFSYQTCCLNVLDIGFIRVNLSIRRPGIQGCPVTTQRTQSQRDDGLRIAMPKDVDYEFPTLNLRPEVGAPGKWFSSDRSGLNCDIYNPPYFAEVPKGGDATGLCNDIAEINPSRDCFKPIYSNGCLNVNSSIYDAPVAFWTLVFEDRVPDAGGVAARSAIFGFHPVYFNPVEVKQAMDIILFDEWQLPRK